MLLACCESDNVSVGEAAGEALAELELGAIPLDVFAFEPDDDLLSSDDGPERNL